jgi:hypothetical protein
MIHFRPIPKRHKRCDLRVKDAIRRETNDCLKKEINGEDYTPPARFVPVSAPQHQEAAEQPWYTNDRD